MDRQGVAVIHMPEDDCAAVRQALELHFDLGESPDARLMAHLAHCTVCATHQADLEALDGFLRAPKAIPADPALEARIRAGLQAQAPRPVPPWLLPVSTAAAVMLLAALGHGLHGLIPSVAPAWSLAAPLLPEWAYLRQELLEMPALAYHEVAWVKAGITGAWDGFATWTATVAWGRSGVLWTVFASCGVAALALNALEWTHRGRRSGH